MNSLDILLFSSPITSVGNEQGQQMRIQILMLGFNGLIEKHHPTRVNQLSKMKLVVVTCGKNIWIFWTPRQASDD